jgi:2-amino-4-hydroxy-6-hydroxymethyldihydropteridine diphosphokinase
MEKITLNRTLISLGSNLGDKIQYLNQAIQEIEKSVGKIEFVSSFHESKAWGYDSENLFMNACITCYTVLSPYELLEKLQEIERQLGRVKSVLGYEDRCIDLDIIFFNVDSFQTKILSIPHPHFKSREFVMIPLLEIVKEQDSFWRFVNS